MTALAEHLNGIEYAPSDPGYGGASVDVLEQELVAAERLVRRLRARQLELVRRLDRSQVAIGDGARSMTEWLASRLDLPHGNASDLVFLAAAGDGAVEERLAAGEVSVERAVLTVRLGQAGADVDPDVYDLSGLQRLLHRARGMTPVEESERFGRRELVIQPSLDQSELRLWGRLPGVDGQVVIGALEARMAATPNQPSTSTRQARADALVSICAEALATGPAVEPSSAPSGSIEVFVDRHGAHLSTGPVVGQHTVDETTCGGRIRTIVTDHTRPVAVSDQVSVVPPAVRKHVWHRDQGLCTIDGCASVRLLQIHHIHPVSQGGGHHPDNLTVLCWYHHHVAIHGMSLQLDPTSPPRRRRFLPRGPAPP
jgi:5-methylcytosine-specific restriction endonuclease McrA